MEKQAMTWACKTCEGEQEIDDTANVEMLIGECESCIRDKPDGMRHVIHSVIEVYSRDQDFDLQDPLDRDQLTDQLLEAVLFVSG